MENVVVLVPGFLGFSRFGGFYYFAERLIGVLRGSLEQPEGGAMPVVPVTTLPTNRLRDRQRSLLQQLHGLCSRLHEIESIHLIGHSTGGVDAQLLACTRTVDNKAWPAEWDDVRHKIKTVVTISAPHYGTELADSRFADLVRHPFNPGALLAEARILAGLARVIPGYVASTVALNAVVPSDLIRFAWQIVQNRQLIDDLTPEKMEECRAELHQRPDVRLVCFVTGTEPRTDGLRDSDPLYSDIYGLTAGTGSVSTEVQRNARFLNDRVTKDPIVAIRNDRVTLMPTITPSLNDGVVNTARQIVRCHAAELGGFVVADHADSMGHYDRQDSLIAGRSFNPGLFHSGAAFEDREFFKLYWRVAEVILGSRDRARAERRAAKRGSNSRAPGSPEGGSPTLASAQDLRRMLRGDGTWPPAPAKKSMPKTRVVSKKPAPSKGKPSRRKPK